MLRHVKFTSLSAGRNLLGRLKRFDGELELTDRLDKLCLDEVLFLNHIVRLQQLLLRGGERFIVP